MELLIPTLLKYVRTILVHVPWEHCVMMGVGTLALTGILLMRKKGTVYGAIALGLTVFVGLFLLDTAVVIRCLGIMPHTSGYDLTLDFARVSRKSGYGAAETLSNIVIFVPLGFFLSEYLTSTKRISAWHRIGLATLLGFGLSLCIECLQLILHVGYFELMDLVMNTLGAFVGAGISVGGRIVGIDKSTLAIETEN